VLDTLSKKFTNIFNKLGTKKRLTEKNIQDSIREIRMSLIEADVNIKVIKSLISQIKEQALGEEVLKSVSPAQQFTKIVHENLVNFLGGDYTGKLHLNQPNKTSSVLLCGLQGSGKTTTCAKIANKYKDNRDVLLASLDVYRPAAQEQLQILGKQIGVDVYDWNGEKKIKKLIKNIQKYDDKNAKNLIIFDTAGRVQIDANMMEELKTISKELKPQENLLVCDSMTGQTAVNVAKEFKNYIDISGLVFTKFDSDTRGGAALSVKYITDKPVKFIGIGEKTEDIDEFSPSRIADRILGMGDVVKFVEKAEQAVDAEKAQKLQEKIKKLSFDLQDFLDQIEQMQKMGSMESLINMMPGMSSKVNTDDIDESQIIKMKAIIQSMTQKERTNARIINGSRKSRIAKGSGTNILQVNQLIKKYNEMKKMMKKMNKPGKMKKLLSQMGLDESQINQMSDPDTLKNLNLNQQNLNTFK